MERRDKNKDDLPWGFSSPRNHLLPSNSSASSTPVNHRLGGENLSSEYHPVGNTATPATTQNRTNNFRPNMSGHRRETLSSIPEYHPENHNLRNSSMLGNHVSFPEYLPNINNFFLPDDNLGYGLNSNPYQYHGHQNLNSSFLEIPDSNQLALQAAMNRLNISNSPYPSSSSVGFQHQAAMDFERRMANSVVNNGQSFTAAPYASLHNLFSDYQWQYEYQNRLAARIPARQRALTTSNLDIHQYRARNNDYSSAINGLYQSRERRSYSSLKEIRGRMAAVAMDKEGCSFLQKKLLEANREEFEAIFKEIVECICDVMMDQFGHHLIQDLYAGCNEDDILKIVLAVSSQDRLMDICLDVHGTRAIQKLLEHLSTREQVTIVLSVLRPITIILTRNVNGHHVVQNCLSRFDFEDTMLIVTEVANNTAELAMDKSGCCVLQTCVTNAKGELRERIIADITANAVIFSENLYGNYVVQYLLGMKEPRIRARVIAQLEGRFVSLSMNKYGSNVVEKCFKECPPEQAAQIIKELVTSPNFVALLQDQYGNYVAQSALIISKGPLWNILVNVIQSHYPSLHSHPYGKRVLAKTRGNRHHHR